MDIPRKNENRIALIPFLRTMIINFMTR